MKPLIDASSIYEAARIDRVCELDGLYTVEIARYEIGNTLWKHTSRLGSYSIREATEMMQLFMDIFYVMNFLQLKGHEKGVLELASELKIPFYDASYIYFALKRELPLVTEDAQMSEKGREAGLECFSIKEV
ncbi:MAG: type II toxin-antitoxin system VapC family toxin [Candidatus Bathyarchaeota archaeon]